MLQPETGNFFPDGERWRRRNATNASLQHPVPHLRRKFNRRRVEAGDAELVADLGQHGDLAFVNPAIRRANIASQRLVCFIQLFRQGIAYQAEERGQPVIFLEQSDDGLADGANPILIIIGKDRSMIDHALNRD